MYERILIPTDGSDVADSAVDHAVDLAAQYGATVHALFVVDPEAVTYSLGSEQLDRLNEGRFGEMEELEAQANEATGYVAAAAREHGVDAVEELRVGKPHEVIANYAGGNDIDLIVIGSHGRSGIRRALLGSVTERVLRSTHRPVMVVDYREPEE